MVADGWGRTAGRVAVVVALAWAGVSGCSVRSAAPTEPPAPSSSVVPPAPVSTGPTATDGRPPPFLVRAGGGEFELEPDTFCWVGDGRGMCVDGVSLDPRSIGSVATLEVWAPTELGRLTVSLVRVDDEYGTTTPVTVLSLGEGWWRVSPAAAPGDYFLDLFASGGPGDMAARLRWTAS